MEISRKLNYLKLQH